MARKKPEIGDMFTQTEPPAEQAPPAPSVQVDPSARIEDIDIPAEGRTMATGVGLKESELELLGQICDEYNIARNGLIRYGVRYFLKAYQAGQVQLELEREKAGSSRPRQLRMD